MSSDRLRNLSRLASPEAAQSEANSSVQVHLDLASNRGRSGALQSGSRPTSRGPSLSRTPEPLSGRQTTSNSQSSYTSAQLERPNAEDVLIDLITPTELRSNPFFADGVHAHGVKRALSYDDGDGDSEPDDGHLTKRDRRDTPEDMLDELEQMAASYCEDAASPAAAAAETETNVLGTDAHLTATVATRPHGRTTEVVDKGKEALLVIRDARRRPSLMMEHRMPPRERPIMDPGSDDNPQQQQQQQPGQDDDT